ncbi:MAG: class I SAM-dependent methyltransferase [Chloroflexi bacterium]|nr:MAG: class I SAM-dependent methyltransferase [Chloroflexota bacterium]
MPVNKHFDLIAPLYERLIPPPNPGRLLALLDLPANGGWMLDAAGETGRVAAMFYSLVDKMAICDLSAAMLRQAAQKGGARPAQARVERLPYADGVFHRVLVVDAFHHFGDQPGAVRELARVLAPGGRLVMEEPDIRRFSTKLIALGETIMFMGSRFRSPEVMRGMLAANGLTALIEVEAATAWVIGEK